MSASVAPLRRRDAAALGGLIVALTFALTVRAAVEPALGEGLPVEVVGALPRPGVHLTDGTLGGAIRAAGGESDDLTPLAEGSRVEVRGDDVRVLAASDPWLLGAPIDLNRASGAGLTTAPGIGPATAAAILDLRLRMGPFHALDELLWVRGVGPSTLALAGPLLTVGDVGPRPPRAPLDVNRATAAELERLPGIGPVRAAAIVADRDARGPYRDVRALTRVRGIGPGTVARLSALVQAR